MLEQKWNKNWKFWEDKDSFALVWNIPEIARNITLPHDAMIEKPANPDSLNGGNTGFRDGDVYTYVKMLHAYSPIIFYVSTRFDTPLLVQKIS